MNGYQLFCQPANFVGMTSGSGLPGQPSERTEKFIRLFHDFNNRPVVIGLTDKM
jgi:hypothetical protein